MPIKKGDKKTGGRKKGVPNKITGPIRERLSEFVNGKLDCIEELWNELEAKEKLQLLKDLLKYVVPALQSIEYTKDEENYTDEVEQKLKELTTEKQNK